MSRLSWPNKVFLEAVLDMGGGYVLDFSNTSFAGFFRALGIDIYDEEKYPGGAFKADRLRALWRSGSDAEVSSSLIALANYIEAKNAAHGSWGVRGQVITEDQILRIREIASELDDAGSAGAGQTAVTPAVEATPAAFTTEATVTGNKIHIEIHEDIYNHIVQYLAAGDYFHAVEESYKLVREKLREITGKEKATEAFARDNYKKLFGHEPANKAEEDFFEGVKFLNMAIQFLRNEKAHTPATPIEPNLAVHYVSLASLAYDLITRYVNPETVEKIEEFVTAKRRSYRSAGAFYRDFEGGKWMQGLKLPASMESSAVRRVLKDKWLREADFTVCYDHSNIVLMRLELVAAELSKDDLDRLLSLPTRDSYGNDQLAGMLEFLEFIQQEYPHKISQKAAAWIASARQRQQE